MKVKVFFLHPALSSPSRLLVSAYARVITVERVGKGTVASVLSSARGAHTVSRGARIRSTESQGVHVGNAGDLLSDIRYSHRVLFLRRSSSLFCRPTSTPYRAPRRDSLPHDSRMCFVCITVCNVWAPRYLSYGRGRRSRNGMYVAFSGARRSLRRLIMVILSRRCKLRRSRARRAVTRGPRSGCFAREKVRANRLLQ